MLERCSLVHGGGGGGREKGASITDHSYDNVPNPKHLYLCANTTQKKSREEEKRKEERKQNE